MLKKRVLIISNNALSKTNSNGRTLLNFFGYNGAENIAQFFLQKSEPDFNACKNYFFASDSAVLKAVIKGKSAGKIVQKTEFHSEAALSNSVSKKRIHKNPFTMLVRNFFWSFRYWRKDFYNWVDDFRPECILFQAGDTPFLYNISVEIAKHYDIPLVIYNSEDYYFKDYNYFKNSGITGIFYPLFRNILKKAVKSAIDYATVSIDISEDLKKTYDGEFNKNSVAIYTATEVEPVFTRDKKPIFSYLGNLGVDRHTGLVKIANALNKITVTPIDSASI